MADGTSIQHARSPCDFLLDGLPSVSIIGFARISAEELLTFSIQRVLAIIPFLTFRLLATLTWPGVGSWASTLFSAFLGNSTPEMEVPHLTNGHGGREQWAWFAALAQPLLVGLCAWLHH